MEKFTGLNVPLITIERYLENGTAEVECDNEQGGRLAAQHLIDCGCKHLIHISGVHETAMPADARAAYENRLKQPKHEDLLKLMKANKRYLFLKDIQSIK